MLSHTKFLFISFILFCSFFAQAQIKEGKVSNWVKTTTYLENPAISLDDVSGGIINLLYEEQINKPQQEIYFRTAIKVVENVGTQEASTININYDPSYQQVVIHSLFVIREGNKIDKLDVSNFQEIRRELSAESYIYDGTMTANMNISDIRNGDIVDYSYTIKGFNPINKNTFSGYFFLNHYQPMGKICAYVVSDKKLNYKTFNGSSQPQVIQKNGLYTYYWEANNTSKVDFEENIPVWKNMFNTISITECNRWEDVVNWALELYKVDNQPSRELKEQIDNIVSQNQNDGDKIKATLTFVQEDIRYLGLESGIGNYKPFTPNKVFSQRFGDCKDKSLLVVTMLKEMGFEAYPVLVSTALKQTILDVPPSPKFFDHCVVKVVDKSKNELWFDPTMTNQGGTYSTTYFPGYGYGLVIKEGNKHFDEIFTTFSNSIETIDEYLLEEIGKGGTLNVETTYYEGEADVMRNYFKSSSISSIRKDYENFYSNYYYDIKTTEPPRIEDNLKGNIFKTYEKYKIDSIWRPMPEIKNNISATFIPTSLINTITLPVKKERKHEYLLNYPLTRHHTIKVKLPRRWNLKKEDIIISSDGFYYEWDVTYNNGSTDLEVDYLLKIQNDHIPPEEYDKFVKDMNKLDASIGYQLYIPINSSASANLNLSGALGTSIKMILALLAIIFVVFLFARRITRTKNKSKNELI